MKKSFKQIAIRSYYKFFFDLHMQWPLQSTFPFLLCTVSGGQDSQMTLYICLSLRKFINLTVVYCHHFWQPTNFYCFWEIWKITYLFKISFVVVIAENFVQTESEARNWRKENWQYLADFFDVQTITLGHTASDQIETALGKIFRSTSPAGLNRFQNTSFLLKKNSIFLFRKSNELLSKKIKKTTKSKIATKNLFIKLSKRKLHGEKLIKYQFYIEFVKTGNKTLIFSPAIKYCSNWYRLQKIKYLPIKIVRPLFESSRTEIQKVIKINKFPILFDPTNENWLWVRNRIRHSILPRLRYETVSAIDTNFYQFLTINNLEQDFLNKIQNKIQSHNYSKATLIILPNSIKNQIIYLILESYTSREISLSHIKVISKILKN